MEILKFNGFDFEIRADSVMFLNMRFQFEKPDLNRFRYFLFQQKFQNNQIRQLFRKIVKKRVRAMALNDQYPTQITKD